MPTFLYIDKVENYIIFRHGKGINILGSPIQIRLYANDHIIFVFESHTSRQEHLNVLDGSFRISIKLVDKVEVVDSCLHLGVIVTSTSGCLCMTQAIQLTQGYASLAMLE